MKYFAKAAIMNLKLHFNSNNNTKNESLNISKIEFEAEFNQSKNLILDYQININIIDPKQNINLDNFDIQFNESYNKFTLNYNSNTDNNKQQPSLNNPKYHKEYSLEMDSNDYINVQKTIKGIYNRNLKQTHVKPDQSQLFTLLQNYVNHLKQMLNKKTIPLKEKQPTTDNEKFIYTGQNVLEKLDYYNGYQSNSNQQAKTDSNVNVQSKCNKINIVEIQKIKLDTINKHYNKKHLDHESTSNKTIDVEIKLLINQKYIDKIDNIKIACNKSIQLNLESLPQLKSTKSISYIINYNSDQTSKLDLNANHKVEKLHIDINSYGNLYLQNIYATNELNINNYMYGTIGLKSIECKNINIRNYHKGNIILNDINQKVNKLYPPHNGYSKLINIKNNSSGNINISNINTLCINVVNSGFGTINMDNINIVNCIIKNCSFGNISFINQKLNRNNIENIDISNLSKGNITIQSINITNAIIKLLGLGTLSLKSGIIKNLIINKNDDKLMIDSTFKIYKYN